MKILAAKILAAKILAAKILAAKILAAKILAAKILAAKILAAKIWRKRMGVEPTKDRLAAPPDLKSGRYYVRATPRETIITLK